MKLTTLTAAALIAFAGTASAGSITERITGCETVDMGGYLNFVDPTCNPGHAGGNGTPLGGERDLGGLHDFLDQFKDSKDDSADETADDGSDDLDAGDGKGGNPCGGNCGNGGGNGGGNGTDPEGPKKG